MRKLILVAALAAAVVFAQAHVSSAQDYSECRAQCERNLADCNSQPQASEPEEQTAKEARCSEQAQSCYGECDSMRPPTNDTPPETPPDMPEKPDQQAQPEQPPQ